MAKTMEQIQKGKTDKQAKTCMECTWNDDNEYCARFHLTIKSDSVRCEHYNKLNIEEQESLVVIAGRMAKVQVDLEKAKIAMTAIHAVISDSDMDNNIRDAADNLKDMLKTKRMVLSKQYYDDQLKINKREAH
jgi:hypothetical protein